MVEKRASFHEACAGIFFYPIFFFCFLWFFFVFCYGTRKGEGRGTNVPNKEER